MALYAQGGFSRDFYTCDLMNELFLALTSVLLWLGVMIVSGNQLVNSKGNFRHNSFVVVVVLFVWSQLHCCFWLFELLFALFRMLVLFAFDALQWGAADAEIKVPSVEEHRA